MFHPLRKRSASIVLITALSLSTLGCGAVQSLIGGGAKTAKEAEALLQAGDLDGASAKYEEAIKAAPTDVDAASGAAYMHTLKGDLAGADAILVAAEATAGPRLGEIKMRRTLVAMQGGDLDKVKELGMASGQAAGKLLAAEAHLADGDRDTAKPILTELSAQTGPIGETAQAYLALMNDGNLLVAGLAEVQALWALGQQKVAVGSVEEVVKAYAESHDDNGNEQILMWAGRAAALGEAEVAWKLLDAVSVPPPGQAWRVQATRGIAWCAEGNGAECTKVFDGLSTIAPPDGLVDAKTTAASVIAQRDPATAHQLLQGIKSDGAARVLAALGDKAAALEAVVDPVLKKQLGG